MAVAYAMGTTVRPVWRSRRFWLFTILCCLLPDIDVVGFKFGIPYEHLLGHRGLTHSLLFSLLVGIVAARLAVSDDPFPRSFNGMLILYFSLVTMSHGFLDALTDGGLGIAFFAPFDSTRYFLPWRPLRVSPIGISHFVSWYGMGVLVSEFIWIGIPVIFWLVGRTCFDKWGGSLSKPCR